MDQSFEIPPGLHDRFFNYLKRHGIKLNPKRMYHHGSTWSLYGQNSILWKVGALCSDRSSALRYGDESGPRMVSVLKEDAKKGWIRVTCLTVRVIEERLDD
jgi:hypothetical protein